MLSPCDQILSFQRPARSTQELFRMGTALRVSSIRSHGHPFSCVPGRTRHGTQLLTGTTRSHGCSFLLPSLSEPWARKILTTTMTSVLLQPDRHSTRFWSKRSLKESLEHPGWRVPVRQASILRYEYTQLVSPDVNPWLLPFRGLPAVWPLEAKGNKKSQP